MTDPNTHIRKHCIGFPPLCIHKKLGVKFNTNIFLQNYHICEVQFPDISYVEYDRRVFKGLEIYTTKN